MKKRIVILIALMATLAMLAGSAGAASPPTTFYYGDITLYQWWTGNFPNVWDLTTCDLTLSYTIDMSNQASGGWTPIQVGIREVGGGNLDPNGLGGWMQANWQFPATNPNDLDDDDHLVLVDHGWASDELDYDASGPDTIVDPFGTYNSFAFWFDRDGVNEWQDDQWDMINEVTYNTGGVYDVEIHYHAVSANMATMFATINGQDQGFYTEGWQNDPPDIWPAGRSFGPNNLGQMQIFYGRGGGGGTVTLSDITVAGCLVLQEGMATGGGWFIPEDDNAVGLTNLGGKATFGFVAKQDDKKGSSGHLEFQYHADNLNLKSTSYDWVTLSNTQVIFEGEGALNGEPGYKFRVWAFDGDKAGGQPDRFTIRIWTGVGGSFESPTYRAEGDLGGGQIVVHKK
jgi:hypothetical protein